jgi:nucleoid DNA-binding protein
MSATKKDIASAFSDKTSIHPSTALKMVDQLFDSIMDVLAKNDRIEVRNFGVFESKKNKPRKARNPRTGESIFTIGGFTVKFKAGKEMVARISSMNAIDNTDNQTEVDDAVKSI